MSKSDLAGLHKHLEKKVGLGVNRLGDGKVRSQVTRFFSTGCLFLDKDLGGGIPGGRVTEIFGNEGSGKTTLALETIAAAQKSGYVVMVIDTENALDPKYAKEIGVDIDDLLIVQVECVEEVFAMVRETADWLIDQREDKDEPDPADILIVWDSVAATPTIKEASEEGDNSKAAQARSISEELRRTNPKLAQSGITLICINQGKSKFNFQYGTTSMTSPGGKALKFAATVRIQLSMKQRYKEKDSRGKEIAVGQDVDYRVVKNKVAPPFREGTFHIRFGVGIDRKIEYWEMAIELGIIVKTGKKGAWYEFADEKIHSKKFQRNVWGDLLDNESINLEDLILDAFQESNNS